MAAGVIGRPRHRKCAADDSTLLARRHMAAALLYFDISRRCFATIALMLMLSVVLRGLPSTGVAEIERYFLFSLEMKSKITLALLCIKPAIGDGHVERRRMVPVMA